ncbi:cyclic nucleotide-binding domain-containing protein [Luteolibacter arcticus]|uniref:Cyclic nucleotide-binding domain-containing protein n=1 Tax=Luteolibacter arcticus TaxID=1581411 RepID=A0ABT3GNU2_9BACT|nr:cyclic nucleotide-binding domain-containing protein [Luteolibacter arcticus]MCW1925177.1 cyclic nucleotide-binding domain-containing protein [Luteolibacter arcticus]
MEKIPTGVPIFAGLDDSALELLMEGARSFSCQAGDVIVREGESSNEMFVIAEGSVRIWKGFGTPQQMELDLLKKNDFFGEMCILETLPRAATVQAVGDCELVGVKSMAFYRLHSARPDQHGILVVNLARDLSRRIRALHRRFVV